MQETDFAGILCLFYVFRRSPRPLRAWAAKRGEGFGRANRSIWSPDPSTQTLVRFAAQALKGAGSSGERRKGGGDPAAAIGRRAATLGSRARGHALGSNARGKARQSRPAYAATVVGRIEGRPPIRGSGIRVAWPEPPGSTHGCHRGATEQFPKADDGRAALPAGLRPRRSFRRISLIFQSRRFALWCQPIWITLAAILTILVLSPQRPVWCAATNTPNPDLRTRHDQISAHHDPRQFAGG